MLKEKNVYKEDLPVNVTVADIEKYPIHFHDDLEIVFVLDGTVKLKNGYYTYTLKRGDIFVINDSETHSFEKTDAPNMVMMLQLDLKYFMDYYDGLKNSFFITDMEDDDESIDVLRSIMAKIMMEIIQKGYGYEQKVIESAHNLISCLLSDFSYFVMEDGKFVNDTKNRGDKILAGRLNRITDFMYDNYDRKLTLNEIAEKEHLSIYYLSHVIKEATGLSFQELLSFIRVEESEKLLLGTNKRIGVIAEESGFSALRYYVKHFQRWYGMPPAEYRKRYTGKVASRETTAEYKRSTPEQIELAIKKLVKGIYGEYINRRKTAPIIVDVDLKEVFQEDKALLFPQRIFESEAMKNIGRPFRLLTSLKEKIIESGENYIVTSGSKKYEDFSSISILLYNLDETLLQDENARSNTEKIMDTIKMYDDELEFLIRIAGITGEFRVSRYIMSRENIIYAYEDAARYQPAMGKRQATINNWRTLPHIEFARITAVDTLSLVSKLRGISAELILIDKIQ